ncbi:ORF55 similar to AcMNPV ORF109 [Cydia pomonella granulovirus]|uniref:ORF55 similar to AcMNPV ORF109 n=1 Tax=Cydia pomonella granulosis virus (isolate Mexico/1963) TaxID=654905 RepID=Q91F00_GVCPM|nr:ORF55 similar to AcMNPV ORF109 [Cydia pomonella granulovirus]AAK70715.1 ORF55 similar to AcMNPV ORF109 [Cydia pomonella granulovirus]
MACTNDNVKVYISDQFIYFPYKFVRQTVLNRTDNAADRITVFVATFEDEKAVNGEVLIANTAFKTAQVIKYVSHYKEEAGVSEGVVVYWNVIVPIRTVGVGDTLVFSVVLSDNLYTCRSIIFQPPSPVQCPLQVDCNLKMVCLKGELAGDSQELEKAMNTQHTEYIIHFDKHTPMGVKILNTKRFLIALSKRTVPAKVGIYLTHAELTTVHKELSWEFTRRLLKGGQSNTCNVYNKASYKYILDAMELLNIDTYDVSSIHNLTNIFNPLYLALPTGAHHFRELNSIFGEEKLVRLYCKYESVAVTNADRCPSTCPPKTRDPSPTDP